MIVLFSFFLVAVIPFTSLADESSVQSVYNNCLVEEFHRQNEGPNQCNFYSFQNNPPNMQSILRTCKMAFVRDNVGNPNLNDLTKQINETSALNNLNRLLNSKLKDCELGGKIELSPKGAEINLRETNIRSDNSPRHQNKGSR